MGDVDTRDLLGDFACCASDDSVQDYSLEAMQRAMDVMRSIKPPRKIVLVMHPDNVATIVQAIQRKLGGHSLAICRVSIQASEFVPKLRWQGPDDRFVEYDEVDRNWARGLGIGDMVPAVYEIDAEQFKQDCMLMEVRDLCK